MDTVREAYVTFEVAKLLKEKGCTESSLCWYDDEGNLCYSGSCYKSYNETEEFFGALTQQMAMSWLRNEKNIFIDVCIPASGLKCYIYDIYYVDPKEETWDIILPDRKLPTGKKEEDYSTFEEAAEAGMLYVLKNLI